MILLYSLLVPCKRPIARAHAAAAKAVKKLILHQFAADVNYLNPNCPTATSPPNSLFHAKVSFSIYG